MTRRRTTQQWTAPELSRRGLLRGGLLGGVGLAAAALLGCTEDEEPAVAPVVDGVADPTPGASPTPRIAPTPTPRPVTTRKNPSDPTATFPFQTIGQLVHDPDLPFVYQYPEPDLQRLPGGTLSIGSTIDLESMDPLQSTDGGSVIFPNIVYNRLIGMESGPLKHPFDIFLETELAEGWERSVDGLTFTFYLRGDVHWQNVPPLHGRQFVADDVRFTYERYRQDAGPRRAYWANVGAIDAPDPYTLTVHMARVVADFPASLASRHHPVFPKELVESETIATRGIGTGPMIMLDAATGSHVTFVRNPDYFEREVLLDGVEFKFQPDREERVAAFREGRLDYAHDLIAHHDDVEALLATNPDIQVNLSPVVSGLPLSLNLSNPRFADERVRQAITLVLDPHLMADRVYHSLARVLPLHPWTIGWWTSLLEEEPSPGSVELGRWHGRHDPERATQLLAAAGADALSFESIYHSDTDPKRDDITAIAAEQLAAVGITMQSKRLDRADFDEIWNSGNLAEASTSAFAPDGFDADHFFYHLVHSESPKNLWRLNDPQVDAWAEAQQVELDPEARREILRTMWDYFLDKMYWPPLPSPLGFEVYQPWLRGIRFGGILGTNSSYYDWGDQIAGAWIDPIWLGRQA
ncbi:MAG: ABC transporter substrate-binding protein [Chloroflexota bacterium]|nr:ABC transporter substrate-binding protein [Chloroflexota bacterium]